MSLARKILTLVPSSFCSRTSLYQCQVCTKWTLTILGEIMTCFSYFVKFKIGMHDLFKPGTHLEEKRKKGKRQIAYKSVLDLVLLSLTVQTLLHGVVAPCYQHHAKGL